MRVRFNWLTACAFSCVLWALVGCGFGPIAGTRATGTSPASTSYTGHVHGGQQPVSGAAVFLYAASQSSNAGAATSLLASPGYVTTDTDGNFSITGGYICPAGSYVYLLALGGNPGLSGNVSNPRLALAAGLGPCAGLTSSTFVSINEVTTVATAYSLAAFSTSETQIGFANALNMTNAFGSIPAMVNTASGAALTATPGGNGIVQQAKIYSLADSVAACVNSDGTVAACSRLMTDAGVSSSTPVDTFQALLNLAENPTANVADIYALAGSNGPFQPTLSSAPADWSLPILFSGPVSVSASPSSSSVPQTGTLPLGATISGASGTPFSYLWTTSGTAGQIDDSIHEQVSVCSPSPQVLYRPNTGMALSASASDSVHVQLYTGAGCLPSNAVTTSPNATVAVLAQPVTPAIPFLPTTGLTAAVQLPSGSTLSPTQVTVTTSTGKVIPVASGSFTVPTYAYGSQIAVVLSPNGNPMLMGWLDDTHNVISAQSTAEVLAFYALGGQFMFTPADRETTEAAILNAPGLSQLTQVVANEVSANPDALAATDANLQMALNQFFQGITGITPRVRTAIAHGVMPAKVELGPQKITPMTPGTPESL